MTRPLCVLVFSRNRAFQLDGLLRSLFRHCPDIVTQADITVLYRAEGDPHASAYALLKDEMVSVPVTFTEETSFREDVLTVLGRYETVVFLVDDSLFTRPCPLASARLALERDRRVLGVSFRLGVNTTWSYMSGTPQRLPRFHSESNGFLRWRWVGCRHDFGYPLELSASLYRASDILPIGEGWPFDSPSTFEALLASAARRYRKTRPDMLCCPVSTCFSIPANRVQNVIPNPAGERPEYSADALCRFFLDGGRLDISAYDGFVPRACHQEVRIVPMKGSAGRLPFDREHGCPPGLQAKESRREVASPVVSVVMPARNAEFTIKEAVRSILAQSLHDFELLICDDGSVDGTRAVLREIQDPRIRILAHERPAGLPNVRNELLTETRGTYIAMMDADDVAHPRRLELQCAVLERHPDIGVCGAWVETFGEGRPFLQSYPTSHEELACMALFESPVAQPSSMIRGSLLRSPAGPYDESFPAGEDYDLFVRLLERTRFTTIPLVLHRYRRHAGQAGESMRDDTRAADKRIHRRLLERLEVDFDEDDLAIHETVAHWEFPADPSFVEAVHDWFLRLITANESTEVFEKGVFLRSLRHRFFLITGEYAPLGTAVYRRLHRLPLARQAEEPFRMRAVHWLKAIVKPARHVRKPPAVQGGSRHLP
ncbi:MAG: glycosyltransferase family A protein [Bacteroidota bacterium]|nr:glycosyltransferase family A protein [Bacteroidota bacterium]